MQHARHKGARARPDFTHIANPASIRIMNTSPSAAPRSPDTAPLSSCAARHHRILRQLATPAALALLVLAPAAAQAVTLVVTATGFTHPANPVPYDPSGAIVEADYTVTGGGNVFTYNETVPDFALRSPIYFQAYSNSGTIVYTPFVNLNGAATYSLTPSAFTLSAPPVAGPAQVNAINNNVAIGGNLDVYGNLINFGSLFNAGAGLPAVSITETDTGFIPQTGMPVGAPYNYNTYGGLFYYDPLSWAFWMSVLNDPSKQRIYLQPASPDGASWYFKGNRLTLFTDAGSYVAIDAASGAVSVNGTQLVRSDYSGTLNVSGTASPFTVGYYGNASGDSSFADGGGHATGYWSTSLGGGYANGMNSLALGYDYNGDGNPSFWVDAPDIADGNVSVALNGSHAVGDYSDAFGLLSTSNGVSSIALSGGTSNGQYSFALGSSTSQSYLSATLGRFNEIQGTGNEAVWDPADDLFIIGNGADADHPSNALAVRKDGQLRIGQNFNTATDTDGTDHKQGVFVIGAGTSTDGQNALRALVDGSILVLPKGDVQMGIFTGGPRP